MPRTPNQNPTPEQLAARAAHKKAVATGATYQARTVADMLDGIAKHDWTSHGHSNAMDAVKEVLLSVRSALGAVPKAGRALAIVEGSRVVVTEKGQELFPTGTTVLVVTKRIGQTCVCKAADGASQDVLLIGREFLALAP